MKRILLINGLLAMAMLAGSITDRMVAAMGAPAAEPPSKHRSNRSPQTRFEKIYHKAWQDIRENYYEPARLSGWERWQHAFDGRLKNRAQLVAALTEMLKSLNDNYTYVLAQKDQDERQEESAAHVVHSRMLDGAVGYIKVDNLRSDSVVGEFARALRKLSKADSYVLDLRGNHGGYIALSNDLFAMLTDSGPFMSYSGRSAGNADVERFELSLDGWYVTKNGDHKLKKRLPDLSGGKPLVVLVDKDTRSAAELLSGALRENRRATVVGERTFGKGVLQNAFELGDSLEMKVVTARYFLPDGDSIHEKGLLPDVVASADNADSPLQQARDVLKQQLRRRPGLAGFDSGPAFRNF